MGAQARRGAIATVLVAAGIATFVALGVWQLERRSWKLQLIERVSQRLASPPIDAPAESAWAQISADGDAYRQLRVAGQYLRGRDTLVQAVTVKGAGYWVMTPLQSGSGFLVLVNRGFVAAADAVAPPSDTPVVVHGLLRLSEPRGAFLRSNNAAVGRWYSRDVAAIAAARGLIKVAPYFIDADATRDPGASPIGGLTVVSFTNHHLQYALTWFALALLLAVGAFRVRYV